MLEKKKLYFTILSANEGILMILPLWANTATTSDVGVVCDILHIGT